MNSFSYTPLTLPQLTHLAFTSSPLTFTPHSLHPDLLALGEECFMPFSQLQSTLKGVTHRNDVAVCEVIYVALHHLLDLCVFVHKYTSLPRSLQPHLSSSPHLPCILLCSPLSSSLSLSSYNFFFPSLHLSHSFPSHHIPPFPTFLHSLLPLSLFLFP